MLPPCIWRSGHRAGKCFSFPPDLSHSLSSCLDMPIDSQPEYVPPGVTAIEIDSEAEFEALKQQYAGDIERFLESALQQF